jgi:hypothetical protein
MTTSSLTYGVAGTPVLVGPGQCKTISVEIFKPAGLLQPWQSICYTIAGVNLNTGTTFKDDGSLLGAGNQWCFDPPEPSFVVAGGGSGGGVSIGQDEQLSFPVENTGEGRATLNYTLRAVVYDMSRPNTTVGLNGLPPGVDVTGQITLAPGEMDTVTVSVRMSDPGPQQPFNLHDVVLLGDIDGDGAQEPLSSIGIGAPPSRHAPLYLPRVLRQ